jgi:uncharacterized protein with LGFP repeats
MPARDLALTAVYQTAIDARYAAIGGASSVLGKATKAEYVVTGGRARDYAGGRMYWGASSGAHYLTGVVLTKYLGLGGPAKFGLPTNDITKVTGGDYALMSGNRSIFHKTGRAAFPVTGAILTRYKTLGYQASCLGFPTAAQVTTATGLRQAFEHGTMTYTNSTKKTTNRCT